MAKVDYIKANNVRIYKDGVYITTATALTTDANQDTTVRNYIGDEEDITLTGQKTFEGSLTRDMTDEGFLEHIIGRSVTTKFTATNYDDTPDQIKGTVDNVTDVDQSFTTPAKSGLKVQAVSLNLAKTGSFTGGLDVEVWEGAAGTGTLKGTLNIPAGQLPVDENDFVTVYIHPEASEFSVTSNAAHTLRLTAGGAPTGSVDAYGPTAAGAGEFYFAIEYEMDKLEPADYTLDIVMTDDLGNEIATIRDTGITWTSDNLTMNPNEPISEATGWIAKKRTII